MMHVYFTTIFKCVIFPSLFLSKTNSSHTEYLKRLLAQRSLRFRIFKCNSSGLRNWIVLTKLKFIGKKLTSATSCSYFQMVCRLYLDAYCSWYVILTCDQNFAKSVTDINSIIHVTQT